MAGVLAKRFDAADERRPFVDKGYVDIINLGETRIMRGVFEPGWRWSEHVKPIAKTDSCQMTHNGYVLSGRMGVRMDDGTEAEAGPGDAVMIAPGHDAWTVGDEACVLIDFGPSVAHYAERQ